MTFFPQWKCSSSAEPEINKTVTRVRRFPVNETGVGVRNVRKAGKEGHTHIHTQEVGNESNVKINSMNGGSPCDTQTFSLQYLWRERRLIKNRNSPVGPVTSTIFFVNYTIKNIYDIIVYEKIDYFANDTRWPYRKKYTLIVTWNPAAAVDRDSSGRQRRWSNLLAHNYVGPISYRSLMGRRERPNIRHLK